MLEMKGADFWENRDKQEAFGYRFPAEFLRNMMRVPRRTISAFRYD
jgi:hypothetical protein